MKQVCDARLHQAIQQRLEIAGDLLWALIADAHQDRRRRDHRLVAADAHRERVHGRGRIAAKAHDQKPDHGIPEPDHRPGQGHDEKHKEGDGADAVRRDRHRREPQHCGHGAGNQDSKERPAARKDGR
jgi:hypothetical protein